MTNKSVDKLAHEIVSIFCPDISEYCWVFTQKKKRVITAIGDGWIPKDEVMKCFIKANNDWYARKGDLSLKQSEFYRQAFENLLNKESDKNLFSCAIGVNHLKL